MAIGGGSVISTHTFTKQVCKLGRSELPLHKGLGDSSLVPSCSDIRVALTSASDHHKQSAILLGRIFPMRRVGDVLATTPKRLLATPDGAADDEEEGDGESQPARPAMKKRKSDAIGKVITALAAKKKPRR